jgi:hypothetical protein
MKPARKGKASWRETTVSLSSATLTTFVGPGDDITLVVSGQRDGASRTTRQVGARPTSKGGRS